MPMTLFWRWPPWSLFSIILLFLGYRIFRGYKELCNAAERLPDVTHVIFVLNYFIVSRLPDISRVQRAPAMTLNTFLTWSTLSLFSIILMFLGYWIFCGYKELCNADERLSDVTCVIFVFNSFDVSRLLDIPRVQRAVQCSWTPSWLWPASSLFSILLMFLGYRIFRGYKELCNAAEHLPDGDLRCLWSQLFYYF